MCGHRGFGEVLAPARFTSIVRSDNTDGVTLMPYEAAVQGHMHFEPGTRGSFDVAKILVRVAVTVKVRVLVHGQSSIARYHCDAQTGIERHDTVWLGSGRIAHFKSMQLGGSLRYGRGLQERWPGGLRCFNHLPRQTRLPRTRKTRQHVIVHSNREVTGAATESRSAWIECTRTRYQGLLERTWRSDSRGSLWIYCTSSLAIISYRSKVALEFTVIFVSKGNCDFYHGAQQTPICEDMEHRASH